MPMKLFTNLLQRTQSQQQRGEKARAAGFYGQQQNPQAMQGWMNGQGQDHVRNIPPVQMYQYWHNTYPSPNDKISTTMTPEQRGERWTTEGDISRKHNRSPPRNGPLRYTDTVRFKLFNRLRCVQV